ncbi:hypothetical protein [Maribacter sp. 2308TA10-17]|uniref:hypothetical protein n=1 Tax=Maribacter sp. 2308TA10-17 TaxID=3386276 RepID=UPI0039BC7538
MKKFKYIEWLNAEEMHDDSTIWFSELKFIRDEQFFLNNLVLSFTLQLMDSKIYEDSKAVIARLQQAEKDITPLFKKVQAHENQLEIVVDDVDQLKMEKAYLETHEELKIDMNDYTQKYREIKEQLFKLLTVIMKKDKQKRLLN